jgi:hypothetical protein
LIGWLVPLAGVTTVDVSLGVLDHPRPIKVPGDVFIGFVDPQMSRSNVVMVFVQDFCPQSLVVWYCQSLILFQVKFVVL